MLQHFVVAQNEEYDPNWCKLEAEFGPENCPIQRGDYDRCVTCTSTYFYSCGKYKNNTKVWSFKDFTFALFIWNALIFLSNGFRVYCIYILIESSVNTIPNSEKNSNVSGCCFEVVDEIGLNPNRCTTW